MKSTNYAAPHHAGSSTQFLNPPVTSSLFGSDIVLSILFSNILNLCSSLNVGDQVSHPYKTKGKFIVLYILIFAFKIKDGKTKDSELRGIKHFQDLICS
jgi:hypothetical protein